MRDYTEIILKQLVWPLDQAMPILTRSFHNIFCKQTVVRNVDWFLISGLATPINNISAFIEQNHM